MSRLTDSLNSQPSPNRKEWQELKARLDQSMASARQAMDQYSTTVDRLQLEVQVVEADLAELNQAIAATDELIG